MKALLLFAAMVAAAAASFAPGVVDQRPQYHFMPAANWTNDPNGPMYWKGKYHLFYQYNPFAPVWDSMHWGHGISDDLVHWQELPWALAPDQPYDINGIFSGSVTIVPEQGPVIFYTGVDGSGTQRTCIATPANLSDPYLLDWIKYKANPVMEAPAQLDTRGGFRDPTTAWTGPDGNWHMITGCGLVNGSDNIGMALEFKSADFFNWTFEKIFSLDQNWPNFGGGFWECPDFYPANGAFVLKFSDGPDNWVVGDFDPVSQDFTWETRGIYDQGQFYASKTFYDPIGDRQILWGWVAEEDAQSHWIQRGWANIQSLPRVITVDSDLQVRSNPLPELAELRGTSWHFNDVTASSATPQALPGVLGDSLELSFQIGALASSVTSFGIDVRASPTTTERTRLRFTPPMAAMSNMDMPSGDFYVFAIPNQQPSDCANLCELSNSCVGWTYVWPNTTHGPEAVCCLKANIPNGPTPGSCCTSGLKGAVAVYRNMSSLTDTTPNVGGWAPFPWGRDTTVRIFLDRSVMEVYVDEGASVITSRIYPSSPDSLGVEIFASGGEVAFPEIDVYEMGSIWVNSTMSFTPKPAINTCKRNGQCVGRHARHPFQS